MKKIFILLFCTTTALLHASENYRIAENDLLEKVQWSAWCNNISTDDDKWPWILFAVEKSLGFTNETSQQEIDAYMRTQKEKEEIV